MLLRNIIQRSLTKVRVNVQLQLERRNATVASPVTLDENVVRPEAKELSKSDQKFNSLQQRFVYPEFLPNPTLEWRNPIREKLERIDMMRRRSQVDLPEFYVGSILAVTSSTQHAVSKQTRFLGICIKREGCGLRASFVLRNVIDHIGIEIRYFLYDPKILKLDVIKLEKRLDDELYYLRDALPEYSTFPEDMEPEILPDGMPIPINTTKVVMKPRPWYARWERTHFQGINRELMMTHVSEKMKMQIPLHEKPWEKYDLMKQYRSTIPEEEQKDIFAEVDSELHKLELLRKKQKRKRAFVKPLKSS
ncbi:ribosomal protein L19 [Nesidiocoris tenuis]|uniref:Large ribosomal subunit protein bL19m n=1 Tax=Nesidiocoris tenuis TaxID=355587 RepID=A0ABN7APQ3_9HEMI|nr:ribosomal protein L19 [Nesidiocoris tenuis]